MRNAVFPVIVFALLACHRPDAGLSQAVRDYNQALVSAFRTGDLAPLKKTAGEKEVKKVTALVDLKRADGLVLESELAAFEVDSTERLGPSGATVTASETWKYHDRALIPGKTPGERFVSKMTMEYTLELQRSTWRVTQVRTLSNEFLEPKGFRIRKEAHGPEASR